MSSAPIVLSYSEWVEAIRQSARPPTSDDVSITLDGRRLDTKEKVLAFLAEIETERAAGNAVRTGPTGTESALPGEC